MAGQELAQLITLFFTFFIMMVGFIFTVVPPLPGPIIMWAAAIFYGWMVGWENLGWITLGLITFFMIVGVVVDIAAGHFGAKMGGASCLAIAVGAILGLFLGIVASLIGTPILGCLAGLIGMIGSILWIEWRRNNDWETAVRATKGYIAGSAAGMAAKVASGVIIFGIFLARVYGWT